MSELTLPDAARSNTVKQLDRRSRGNLKCKYMLFLVQISMQMHTLGAYSTCNEHAAVIKRITRQRNSSLRAPQYLQISGYEKTLAP